jgi:uncharacterized protein
VTGFAGMTWLNPPDHRTAPEGLTLVTAQGSDFWRTTFYGFVRDSGHFLHAPAPGDFSAEVTVTADYTHLYDQAGLMARVDAGTWVKAGVEYTDGQPFFSVVVTRDLSDWSTMPLPFPASPLRLRLTRHGDAIRVQVKTPAGVWLMARLGALSAAPAQVGIMACSPERAGFRATFTDFTLGPAIDRRLHD